MTNGMKTALLLGALSGLLLLIGDLLGGAQGLMFMFVIAIVMNMVSYWFSDKIVLRMYNAQEVGAGHPLYETVTRLARQADLPMPRVYVIPTDSPNAFATGRNPSHAAVAATNGILRVLDQRELEGVLAHELAHVKNRDTLTSAVAATIAAAIMMMARMAGYAAMFGGGYGNRDSRSGNPLAAILMMVLAPIAAMFIQMWISRTREFAADAAGARIVGSPYGLADALRKIDRISKQLPLNADPATSHLFIIKPFSGEGLMSLFASHPPTEQRIERLMNLR
jgi:heat shock protein HtpX